MQTSFTSVPFTIYIPSKKKRFSLIYCCKLAEHIRYKLATSHVLKVYILYFQINLEINENMIYVVEHVPNPSLNKIIKTFFFLKW